MLHKHGSSKASDAAKTVTANSPSPATPQASIYSSRSTSKSPESVDFYDLSDLTNASLTSLEKSSTADNASVAWKRVSQAMTPSLHEKRGSIQVQLNELLERRRSEFPSEQHVASLAADVKEQDAGIEKAQEALRIYIEKAHAALGLLQEKRDQAAAKHAAAVAKLSQAAELDAGIEKLKTKQEKVQSKIQQVEAAQKALAESLKAAAEDSDAEE